MRVSVLRAALTVGGFTGASRIAGFVRDVLIAAALGAGPAADAFFVSFKLANVLRRLFAEGAVAAAFVPLFARVRAEVGEDGARRFLHETLSALFWLLVAIVVLAEIAMPWLIRGLAPGFDPGGARYALAVSLGRVTFPYILLISLAAVLGGALNAVGRFAAVAAAPILLNLVLIAASVAAFKVGLAAGPTLAWGVAVGGAVQLGWLAGAAARVGLGPRLVTPRLGPRLRRLGILFLPTVAGAGVGQINLVVNSWFASSLATGAVAHLFYADRLVQLPLGLVGVALGTALLPALTTALRQGRDGDARDVLARTIELALLLTMPATVGLVILAGPIVHVLFQRGAFGPDASAATAATLTLMALGLPAQVLVRVLGPACFAREDTATPVRIAGIAMLVNVVAILPLIGPLAEAGIALAGALSAWANALLLAFILIRRGDFGLDPGAVRRLAGIAAGTVTMALLLVALPLPARTTGLALSILGAGLVFFVVAGAASGVGPREMRRLLGSAMT